VDVVGHDDEGEEFARAFASIVLERVDEETRGGVDLETAAAIEGDRGDEECASGGGSRRLGHAEIVASRRYGRAGRKGGVCRRKGVGSAEPAVRRYPLLPAAVADGRRQFCRCGCACAPAFGRVEGAFTRAFMAGSETLPFRVLAGPWVWAGAVALGFHLKSEICVIRRRVGVHAVEVPHSCAKGKNAHEWATPAVVMSGPPARLPMLTSSRPS
jgi:hypothetical protein